MNFFLIYCICFYFILFVLLFFFADFISEKFLISKNIIPILAILVIPVGIRQFLYQILRVQNRPFLYTFSIIVYQLFMLAFFFILANCTSYLKAILFSMIISLFLIDLLILKNISFGFNLKKNINLPVMFESLKYALPQVITNLSICIILYFPRYFFQLFGEVEKTAVIVSAQLFVSNILTPIFSLFLFAIFPVVIKKFEENRVVKLFLTDAINLYCVLFLPLTFVFYFYSKDIVSVVFLGKYSESALFFPCFSLIVFFHVLMKIFNFGNHLNNKTYLETFTSLIIAIFSIFLIVFFVDKFGLIGVAFSLFVSFLLLFSMNVCIQFKFLTIFNFLRIFRCVLITMLILIASNFIVQFLDIFFVLKIGLYLLISYISLFFIISLKLFIK